MKVSDKNIVALLPMKAHSERVKGKNFRDFYGKPLFRWILDSLLDVEGIRRVVINTDARHILTQNGLTESDRIQIRDRMPELCGDLVSMNRILADDIRNVGADIYLMTHTTNPLLSSITIQNALEKFIDAHSKDIADSLFTVNKIQTRFYRADCSPVNHDPSQLLRTQDLEAWYEENSNLYIFTRTSFQETDARIGRRPMMYESPRFESIDIDDQDDWKFAQAAASFLFDNANSELA